MKRKYIVVIVVVIIIISFIGTNIYKQHEYHKYCIDCNAKYVTFNELDIIKAKREEKATSNIEYLEDTTDSYRALIHEDELTSNELTDFNKFKVDNVYDEDKIYNVDELIKIEANYEQVNNDMKNLYINSTIRIYKEEIDDNLKQINNDIEIIESKTLDEYQEKDYAKYQNELRLINYDKSNTYEISEIEKLDQNINKLRRHFDYLAD